MKNVNQFVPLTDNEILEINGGGPLDGLTSGLAPLITGLGSAATSVGAGAAASLILAGTGVNNVGIGINNFLTQLGGAIKITA